MTLNITILTPRRIYQSADYRLRSIPSGVLTTFKTQKITLVIKPRWSATVCFAGIGTTHNLDVSEWLDDKIDQLDLLGDFESLIEAIRDADSWLRELPPPDDEHLLDNRHSFSIGAFIGIKPIFVQISNFERRPNVPSRMAAPALSVFREDVTRVRVYVSGQSITRSERIHLQRLAMSNSDPERIRRALQEVNCAVAMRTSDVSEECFVTHLSDTGDDDAHLNNPRSTPFLRLSMVHSSIRPVITDFINGQSPQGAFVVGMTGIRNALDLATHEARLRENPDDSITHSNYGAFLENQTI